ncbi:MAG: ABC transporter permease subunit [Rubinisphaera brasiliensis]|uniref:ABC transporter permease subunit n=1 Tax=Rubinisphaera brasiliensis TaxID=119 RepID=UPI00391876E0
MEQLKYSLLKAINVSGLTFLEPVVRLCYGEEPREQLRKIGRFILIPAATFGLFLWAWAAIAPVYKTKSGEVPTPSVVYSAAQGIQDFHNRESDKEAAYTLTADDRQTALAQTEADLDVVKDLREQANRQVKQAQAAKAVWLEEELGPINEQYAALKEQFAKDQKRREAALRHKAAGISQTDLTGKNELLAYIRGHQLKTDEEAATLADLEEERALLAEQTYPELSEALRWQTELAEREQYLQKKQEILSRSNRELKLAEQNEKLQTLKREYAAASGPQMLTLAEQMLQQEERISSIAASEYAKPWTLPMQIVRSVACVFAGFFLATAIAVPIGILCGVSTTFMAAVTPFIALFKPVSPIVWLPISLIIVGGVITDPDDHWLITTLAELPLIGWLQINPAFIASAITVALCSLWPTLVNTALGVASIDKDHLNVARVLRLSFFQRLTKIVIPSALPLIFAGLRISLGVGWMVLIAAELLSSSEGIGKFVWDMFNNGSSATFAQMFVVVFVVGAIGLLLDRIMIVFQRLVSFDGAPAAI